MEQTPTATAEVAGSPEWKLTQTPMERDLRTLVQIVDECTCDPKGEYVTIGTRETPLANLRQILGRLRGFGIGAPLNGS